MDGERFDTLTKALSAPSRRKFLRLLAATFLVPAALQRRDLRAAADCTVGGAPCDPVITCCSGACGADGRCPLDPGQQCETAAQCGSGVCQVVGTTEVVVPGKKKKKKKGKGKKGKKKGRKTTKTVEVKECAA
jgi:hypothetical protein